MNVPIRLLEVNGITIGTAASFRAGLGKLAQRPGDDP
jgi:hypothetical protein